MESKEKILIIDDEVDMHGLFKEFLGEEKYELTFAATGEEGISRAKEINPTLVLLDLQLPGISGMEVLQQIKEINKDAIIIIITGFGTVETAVKSMKMGAYDYIAKPFRIADVTLTIERALHMASMAREISYLRSELKEKYKFNNIVGRSEPIMRVFDMIRRVAQSSSTVLIQGESGTGKELVARAIHYNSPRAAKPFIAVNCAALPEGLLESELFGYEKGSFTGAYAKKEGKFELADGGTLLLDEITEMSPVLQAKLLRVLQEKEVDRIGSKKPVKIDTRIIATTNADLQKMIHEKKFREDLYYRLNVVSIKMPPLRERRDDIPLLVNHFLAKYNKENCKNLNRVEPAVIECMMKYEWPGNVRELEHVVEKAVVMGEGEVYLPEYLPINISTYASEKIEDEGKIVFDIGTPVEEVERQLLLATLQKTRGNRTEAAHILKISPKTLTSKLNKYKEVSSFILKGCV